MRRTENLTTAWTVLLGVLAALVVSCGGDGSSPGRAGDAPDASVDGRAAQSASSASPAARTALGTATKLAAADARLASRLAPSPRAWERKASVLESAGYREGSVGQVGARLPSRADGALRVGLGRSEAHTLTFTPEGAQGAAAEEDEGRVVYRDAYRATDVVFVASASRVEWLYVLREESAPARFAYTLELPAGLPAVKREGAEGLAFVDGEGEARLHLAAPYAVDAKGERREAHVELEGERLVVGVETAGLTYPVLLDPAIETGVWEQLLPATRPPTRYGHALAYDDVQGTVLLFGGISKGVRFNDTWAWDGAAKTWTNVTPSTPAPSPPARTDLALAYDAAQHQVVLFGGYGGSGPVNDTWAWDGAAKTWTNVTPSGANPSARYAHALAYDTVRGKVVLFGGFGNSGRLSDTWEWDGATKTWTDVTPTGTNPSARHSHALAYDSARDRTVLFGGHDGTKRLDDTWEWNGANETWTSVTPLSAKPSARNYCALAYDDKRGKVVLFGGLGSSFLNDTWEWDGAAKTWTDLTPAGTKPSARNGLALAWDRARGRVVLFGGGDSSTYGMNDTWEYHTRGGACSCPPGQDNCTSAVCDTGYCVDGVCCDAGSLATTSPPNCGTCARCDTAAKPGVCTALTNGQDDDTCTGADVCGPTGLCGAPDGQTCSGPGDCASGFCADGFCCHTACAGACDRCDGAAKGICATVPVAYAGSPSCAPYVCDGVYGTCPASCASDASCAAGFYCDAGGSCVASKAKGAACNQGAGQDCQVAGCRDCASGSCVDGYCCESGCGGSCQTCAATPGTCTTVKGADDAPQCTGANACDATGACKKRNGQGCGDATQCVSGFCADGACCNSACAGGCDVCDATPGTCTVVAAGSAGASPSCSPYVCGGAGACPTSCTSDASCASGFYCNATGVCVAQKTQGTTCDSAAGADCKQGNCRVCSSGGNCVDGFCCNTACSGACDRCDGATQKWSGATDGLCAPAPAGDPGTPACGAYTCNGTNATCAATSCTSDLYCSPSHYCDQSGHCSPRKAQAQTCNVAAGADCLVSGCRVCETGNCVDGYCCDSACGGACDVCSATPGTCTKVAKGAPGAPSCAPYLCPGGGASCGTSCGADSDCATNGWCDPNHQCQLDQPNGGACSSGSQCASGFCVDGVCCNTACGGNCQACAKSLKQDASADGTCGNASDGKDPHDDCGADAPASCQQDGACNGSGQCRLYPQGASCGGTSCQGNLVVGAICDGLGKCATTTTGTDCAPYVCKGTGCAIPCAADSECTVGNFCDAGTCKVKVALGAACTAANQCSSGFCVEGMCCDTACNGTCQACTAGTKGSGADDGTCGAARVGLDPHDDCVDEGVASCGRDGMCDGSGACRLYPSGSECLPADCGGGNVPTTHACNGTGTCVATAKADCQPNVCVGGECKTACTTDGDCAGSAWCHAGVCDAKGDDGKACTGKNECVSNVCVDGVCCNSACTGQCEACAELGSEGTCTPVTGAPRGVRTACASGTAGDVCAAASCDGTTRDECVGFVGPSVSCRAASCAGGVATVAAKCDGKGGCPAEQTVKCEPYVCAGDGCGKAPCSSDTDCSKKFKCAAPPGKTEKDCIPRDVATCDDDHTVTAADGVSTTDCSPYKCDPDGSCKLRCGSVDDCASPNVCDANGKCVAPEATVADDEGGCGCRVAGESRETSGRGAPLLAVLVGLTWMRRRRGASPRRGVAVPERLRRRPRGRAAARRSGGASTP